MNVPKTELAEVDRDYPKLKIESVVDAMNVELRTVAGEAFKTLLDMVVLTPLNLLLTVILPT